MKVNTIDSVQKMSIDSANVLPEGKIIMNTTCKITTLFGLDSHPNHWLDIDVLV